MNCGGTYVVDGRPCQGCPSCDYVAAAAARTDGRQHNGGSRPGSGRKPTGGPLRSAWVRVAVYREQREMWRAAAEASGVTLAEAVREQMDAWALAVLAAPERAELPGSL